ncbi:MAG: CHAT domain-containing protein [Pirellulaceae bacterium]
MSGLVLQVPIDDLTPQIAADVDDGILTSDEIAFLPLENVQLAVLSACETGLGEGAGGEGLLGIQRSFQIAGTQHCSQSMERQRRSDSSHHARVLYQLLGEGNEHARLLRGLLGPYPSSRVFPVVQSFHAPVQR